MDPKNGLFYIYIYIYIIINLLAGHPHKFDKRMDYCKVAIINILTNYNRMDYSLCNQMIQPTNLNRLMDYYYYQFFEEYNEQERNNLRTKYYEMMTDLQTHFSFFDFLDYHKKKISVIEKILSWTKIENHKKLYQTYIL